ncbi:hypothetical protein BDN70DRAFT_237181 [Pholiota conissans]|uniref:RING-type domain-containing protein n=1 Tax=Pholiota conissans TaxID=109636 RepID=A0A9P6CZA5_9AGAR|nr:hypothetical protein BDN70DRAFT_237181 [Pholiota conissans]
MSFSVPSSPAMSRSTKAQPVTPQRLPRHQPRSQSFYRSPLTPTSPYTPMSLRSFDSTGSSILTTPDNLGLSNVKKRLTFSGISSEVARNAAANQSDKSIADIADNWRSRANENGIKVAFELQEDSHYVADDSSDMSLSDVANESEIISSEDTPSLATHRRLNSMPVAGRPRAQSHASLPRSRVHPPSPAIPRNVERVPPPASPLQTRQSVSSLSHSLNLMSTPPPNRALSRQLKLKGSMTDPAQPRRREAFGTVSTAHNIGQRNTSMNLTLEPDTSLDLFDIDENDFEYETDFHDPEIENSFSRNLQALQAHSFGYPTFSPRYPQGQSDGFDQPMFADPFQPNSASSGLLNGHILNGIAESVEHHFQAARQQPLQKPFYDELNQNGHMFYPPVARLPQYNHGVPHGYPAPPFMPIPQPSMMAFQPPVSVHPKPSADRSSSSMMKSPIQPIAPVLNPTDCSVCLASHPESLAILQPCLHPLCSTCLTSALNIVGEKDMECAVCKQNVADFRLIRRSAKDTKANTAAAAQALSNSTSTNGSEKGGAGDMSDKSFLGHSFSSSGSSNAFDHDASNESTGDLESAFEFGLDLGELRASTPKLERQHSSRWSGDYSSLRDLPRVDNVVLRIDNVPWDITPLQIKRWLQQPVERVHVLLDSKGKTLSHAYVEVRDDATAGAILRGEAASSAGRKERGSVLGRGKRARGVTVTRSGQKELMHDLFPCWRGFFNGSKPSVVEAEGSQIVGGLLTEQEISGLLYLIRQPDSHFLKMPSLPFHSLLSILMKLPTDADSRVFYSTSVRDMLLDATLNAIKLVMPRIAKAKEAPKSSQRLQDEEFTIDLAVDMLHTALDCKAFTAQQIQQLKDLAQIFSLPLPEHDQFNNSDSSILDGSDVLKTPSSQDSSTIVLKPLPADPLDKLAKEFGLEPTAMQELIQRLSTLP